MGSDQELPRGEAPTGRVFTAEEKTEKDETKRVQGKLSSTYPPVFQARQGENYRDWKRSVRFWMKGEGAQLPTSIVGPRVMVQLRDRAAQLVKHLEPEDVDGEGGLQLIFNTLEKSPLVQQSERHRVDWHRKRLLNLSRFPGESLESYITRAGIYKQQLEGLDEALSMGGRFYVGHLMDHARLTKRDKAMVKTHATVETETTITAALMELSSELEGEQGYPIGQSESQLSGAQGEEHMVQRTYQGSLPNVGRFTKKDKPALMAEVEYEDDKEIVDPMETIPEDSLGGGDDSDGELANRCAPC